MALAAKLGGMTDMLVRWVEANAVAANAALTSTREQVMAAHRVALGQGSGPSVMLVWEGPAEGLGLSMSYNLVADALREAAEKGLCSAVWACALANVGGLAEALALQVWN